METHTHTHVSLRAKHRLKNDAIAAVHAGHWEDDAAAPGGGLTVVSSFVFVTFAEAASARIAMTKARSSLCRKGGGLAVSVQR